MNNSKPIPRSDVLFRITECLRRHCGVDELPYLKGLKCIFWTLDKRPHLPLGVFRHNVDLHLFVAFDPHGQQASPFSFFTYFRPTSAKKEVTWHNIKPVDYVPPFSKLLEVHRDGNFGYLCTFLQACFVLNGHAMTCPINLDLAMLVQSVHFILGKSHHSDNNLSLNVAKHEQQPRPRTQRAHGKRGTTPTRESAAKRSRLDGPPSFNPEDKVYNMRHEEDRGVAPPGSQDGVSVKSPVNSTSLAAYHAKPVQQATDMAGESQMGVTLDSSSKATEELNIQSGTDTQNKMSSTNPQHRNLDMELSIFDTFVQEEDCSHLTCPVVEAFLGASCIMMNHQAKIEGYKRDLKDYEMRDMMLLTEKTTAITKFDDETQAIDRQIESSARYPLAGKENPKGMDCVAALEAALALVKDLMRQKADPTPMRTLDAEMVRVDEQREDLRKLRQSTLEMLEREDNDLTHARKIRNDLKDKGGPGLGWHLHRVLPIARESGLIRLTDGVGWEVLPLSIDL